MREAHLAALRLAWPLAVATALCGCWGNKEMEFPPGLEPLETNRAPWPEGTDSDPYPEELEVVGGEEDWIWGHSRGYVHASLATTWEAMRDLEVDVDRRRVDEYSWDWDVPQGYDYTYRIHLLVDDIVTVEWDVDWNHGVVTGTLDEPEAVAVRFFKSDGTSFIDMLAGSIAAYKLEDEVTAIEMIEQLDAAATSVEDVTQFLEDFYVDVVAYSHGEPLPEYPVD